MGYSVRGFAELLGFDCHSTYQHYESGRRPAPAQVIEDAKAALERDQRFFSQEMPQRIEEISKKEAPFGYLSEITV